MLAVTTACKKENAYAPPPPPPVGVAKPVQQAVLPYLEVTGNAVAYNQVDLVARVEGFLQEIDYKDGAPAKQGDTLFVIEPTPYQVKLQQAQATAAATQAQLVQSRPSTTGRPHSVATISPPSQQWTRRARPGIPIRQTSSTSRPASRRRQSLSATRASMRRSTAWLPRISCRWATLVGVSGPTKLATIVQLDPIYASFTVSEQDVLRIRTAMALHGVTAADLANLPVEVGLMTETGYPHVGKLDYVAPEIDPSTGTLTVRGLLQNPDRVVLPGMFLRIRIPLTSSKANALLVPDQALGADQSGSYLLVVDNDNVVQQRTVKTGQLVGNLRVIASGLAAEDRVVVSGNQKAIPGEKVTPQNATITADSTPGKT